MRQQTFGRVLKPLSKITVEQFDNQIYHAYCNGDKRLSGIGKNIIEAIGEAIRSHPEELNLVVEVQVWEGPEGKK